MALAGGRATLERIGPDSSVQRVVVDYDGNRLRIEAAGNAGYLLIRERQIYRVQGQGAERLAPESAAEAGLPDLGLGDVLTFVSLDDTGLAETVAGISGQIYLLNYVDSAGHRQRRTLVLSKDARVRELTWALCWAERIGKAQPFDIPPGARLLKEELVQRGAGLLRVGDRYRVLALEDVTPSAARFDLSPAAMAAASATLPAAAAVD